VSRKRKKQAVPAEIVAEGSGPHEQLADDGTLAVHVVEIADEDPAAAVTPAQSDGDSFRAGEKRGRRRRAKRDDVAAADEVATDEAANAEVAADEPTNDVVDEQRASDVAGDAVEGEVAADEPTNEEQRASDVASDVGEQLEADAAIDELAADHATDAPLEEAGELSVADDAPAADDAPSAELAAGSDAGESDEVGDVSAALPTSAVSLDASALKHLVEALVFASDKPVTLLRLRQLTRVSDVSRLEQALAELAADYEHRGLILQQVSGGYQFRTQTRYSTWVQQLIAGRPVRLSRAQLETLAIVAYRQPITRPEIDEIRGVDSSATLKLLLDRALIRILGKKEEAGRPMLYGTTKEFLDFFSLGDLRELPTLREYSELTAESRQVVSDRLGVEVRADGGLAEEVETDTAGPVMYADAAAFEAPLDPAAQLDATLGEFLAYGSLSEAPAETIGHVVDPDADLESAPGEFEAHDAGAELPMVTAPFDLDQVADASSDDIAAAGGELGAADGELEEAGAELAAAEDELDAANDELDAANDELDAANHEIAGAEESLSSADDDMATADVEVAADVATGADERTLASIAERRLAQIDAEPDPDDESN
jgi:segregation and condensation protein B